MFGVSFAGMVAVDSPCRQFFTSSGAVPYDYMSAKPLGYRVKSDGSYVLYSVGEDGKDDGGDPTPPPGTPAGLWSGRDAVWPAPATEPGEPPR